MVLERRAPRGLKPKEAARRENPQWHLDQNSSGKAASEKLSDVVRDGLAKKFLPNAAPARKLTWEERLRFDVQRGLDIYHEKLGMLDVFSEDDPKLRAKAIDDEHHSYAKSIVTAALRPIKERPDSKSRINSVMESVGFGVAIWILDPKFRKGAMNMPRKTMETVDEHVRDRIKAKVEAKSEAGQKIGRRLQRKYDAVLQAEDNGHAPFTEYSAAVTIVGLSDSFYDKVREPNADVERLTQTYHDTITDIYTRAERDGVDVAQIDGNSRYLVGQRMGVDPEYAARFSDTAYGQINRTAPIERTSIDENGNKVVTAGWDGQFEHFSGVKIKTSDPGYLHPRIPADDVEHTTHFAEMITRELESATDAHDLHNKLFSWSASHLPQFEKLAAQRQANGSDYEMQTIESTSRMLRVLSDDGFSEDQSHLIHAQALGKAIEVVSRDRPQIVMEWANEYGAEWDLKFQDMLLDVDAGNEHIRSVDATMSKFSKDRETGRSPLVESEQSKQVIETDGAEQSTTPKRPQPEMDASVDDEFADLDTDILDASYEDEMEESSDSSPRAIPIPIQQAQQAQERAREVAAASDTPEADLDGDGRVDTSERRQAARGGSSRPRTPNQAVRQGLVTASVNRVVADPQAGRRQNASKPAGVVLAQAKGRELTSAQQKQAARRAAKAAKSRVAAIIPVEKTIETRESEKTTRKDNGPSL